MEKQPSSRLCFVCGVQNPVGLQVFFYQDEQGQVLANFTGEEKHQGYPGYMHGGIITALLDEVIGRAAIARGLWGVTAKLEVKFRQPVPLGQTLTLTGELIRQGSRRLEGRGEMQLQDGSIAAEAEGVYALMPEEDVVQLKGKSDLWEVVPD
ncbi:MAG: PaaI family thioesterase [Anaerolineae bacterium]|nr:PaaI family thioesterase [Anaerolineae bacterium]